MSDLSEQDASSHREPSDLDRAFSSCFSNALGELVLTHLRRSFLDRRLAPSARDSELWYLEGQRSVVAHILRMSRRR